MTSQPETTEGRGFPEPEPWQPKPTVVIKQREKEFVVEIVLDAIDGTSSRHPSLRLLPVPATTSSYLSVPAWPV
jgi:hypothetical protein